ncbi:MAG: metallophosphoesterase [Nanoarchaeota archaeon]|nr:metallophosphoesterase [Nanoarchaeota archaeon]
MNYEFISKTLFFPEKGILVIGDLHLGYDYMIQQSGVLIPERQVKDIIEELKEIFKKIKEAEEEIKKIIFLGDIKHSFSYEWKEKNFFNEVLSFLEKYFDKKDIIFIKGNHDTMDYSFGKMKDYYISGDVTFLHGDKSFLPVLDKEIKTIVMGHIHPSVVISEKKGVKKEKYKCFLVGKSKGKEIIILPSFLASIEGGTVNNFDEEYEDYFSIVPKKDLMKFEVYVVGDDKVYDFGKVKDLTNP